MTALAFSKTGNPRSCDSGTCSRPARWVVHIASHPVRVQTLTNDPRMRVCGRCKMSMEQVWADALEGFPAQDEQACERLSEAA
jgi:hypothetical protein